MEVGVVRREIEELTDLPTTFKIDLICAGVAFIGVTFLANEELERSQGQKLDASKIYVGTGLILAGTAGYAIRRIFSSCFGVAR